MENFQDYIESGILEQYALGELSAAEQAAVEAQAASHPAIRAELEQVQAALGFYAEAHAIAPPAAMRERVLSNVLAQIAGPAANASLRADVDAVAQTTSRPGPVASAPQPVAAAPEAVVRPMSSAPVQAPASRSGWAIAASVALLLSLGGNMLLYSNWKNASSELVALQNNQSRFAATTQVVNEKLGALQQENQVLRNDEFRAVALAGTKTAPSAHARVLFNVATHKVYIDVRSLPPLPADKQYQLWALDNGKPIDAGVLTVATASGEGLQHMKDIASAQTFAMTIEPAGGSAGPTLSTMTVVGNI
ncbi:anti-sigma factor domain-containing protein [Hymenobacter artigasi]|uniref:Regulator of SigK n=1 Tax=Hymenobacter artigasi TaxID=2719616 RepID=A0ABX1HFQ7_9BACT|nr:anti-sigma factor [Hymenobacter artigasi]NKI89064.1 anti-sigma-K factor RskA [Hymenobacter artigasi]